jgi:hypothetical protein
MLNGVIALGCFLLAGIAASPVIVLAAIVAQLAIYYVLSKRKPTEQLESISAE